jgi:hypothetical protein
VHHEADGTYYVLDLVCWNGFELYDCTAEFRLFFLRSKYQEEERLRLPPQPHGASSSSRIVPVDYHDCDARGLEQAYRGPAAFARDGLLLLLKQGYYLMGLSPLALAWKDAACSRYMALDMAPEALAPPQRCVLCVGPAAVEGGPHPLQTLDGATLLHASPVELQQHGLRPGDLARFRLDAAAEHAMPVRVRVRVCNMRVRQSGSREPCSAGGGRGPYPGAACGGAGVRGQMLCQEGAGRPMEQGAVPQQG